ncbi:MAG: UDP-3-O-(3-hydroxymyristoyl)glucosamine N-acyltransferase [Vampirovibrionales bacterium]|nr:UDP-3-O-(3-hydroxymyristoyl)glucosamine N-acyltransferase [Vampirovibrionales bacterium]
MTATLAPSPTSSSQSASQLWTVGGLAEFMTALVGPGATTEGQVDTPVTAVSHPKYAADPNAMLVVLDEAIIPLLQQAVAQQGHPFYSVLTAEKITLPKGIALAQLKHPRPRVALGVLLKIFSTPPYVTQGIHPTAIVDPTTTLGSNVTIGAYTFVGPNCTLGDDVTLMPHVTLGANVAIGDDSWLYSGVRVADNCVLGKRVMLHHNVSIGADGFSYVTPEKGSVEAAKLGEKITAQNTTIHKIESLGNVILEDDVEVGANSTIDRANLGPTLVKKGTKIDNLVMIGHNNTLGENCLIAGQVGIAGSCVIGDRVVLGGQVGTADHLTLGDDAIVMAKSGLMRDVPASEIHFGTPAENQRDFFKKWASLGKVSALRATVRDLEKRLSDLEQATHTH